MEFCVTCKNYLYLKEQKVEEKRTLFYYCKKCEYKKECVNKKISFKIYKKTDNTVKDSYMNKYKVTDKTLPTKHTKCQKCKKTNDNPYEVKYSNNCYNLNVICSKCHHNWTF